MKKIIAVLLSVIACVSMFTACAGGGSAVELTLEKPYASISSLKFKTKTDCDFCHEEKKCATVNVDGEVNVCKDCVKTCAFCEQKKADYVMVNFLTGVAPACKDCAKNI